jgi:pantoate--beta-alanine ligase
VRLLTTIAEARAARRELRSAGKTLGLVPTMGALHPGHLALVDAAMAACDEVLVSIFVNPTQFGPREDLNRYPHDLDGDCAILDEAGVELVFAPAVEEMYPSGSNTFVEVAGLSDRLDGASRPGHFRGVATVVAKLLQIVQPDRVFFGQKDAVQVAVLKRMMLDLDIDVGFEVCPIVRDADGLAFSSRNRYLSPEERRRALVLPRSLEAVRSLAAAGESQSQVLTAEAMRILAREPQVKLDYFAIVDPNTLDDIAGIGSGALVAIAAFVGTTRLIDNILL